MNKCHLCYNPTRGFYCSSYISNDVLCSSHDKTGFNIQKAKVDSTGIEIIINSNFGFGGKSHLYAQIQLNGRFLFNFEDLNLLHVVNVFDPLRFYVRPVETEWDTLFTKVANICNNSLLINTDSIRTYFSELNKLIDASEIEIFNLVSGKVDKWEGSLLVLLHSSRQIKSIIEAMESTIYNYEFVNNQLLETCKRFLIRFKLDFKSLSFEDERSKQIVNNLFTIYEYMNQQKCAVDFITSLMR